MNAKALDGRAGEQGNRSFLTAVDATPQALADHQEPKQRMPHRLVSVVVMRFLVPVVLSFACYGCGDRPDANTPAVCGPDIPGCTFPHLDEIERYGITAELSVAPPQGDFPAPRFFLTLTNTSVGSILLNYDLRVRKVLDVGNVELEFFDGSTPEEFQRTHCHAGPALAQTPTSQRGTFMQLAAGAALRQPLYPDLSFPDGRYTVRATYSGDWGTAPPNARHRYIGVAKSNIVAFDVPFGDARDRTHPSLTP